MRLNTVLRNLIAIAIVVLACYIIVCLLAGAVLMVKVAIAIFTLLVIWVVLGA